MNSEAIENNVNGYAGELNSIAAIDSPILSDHPAINIFNISDTE